MWWVVFIKGHLISLKNTKNTNFGDGEIILHFILIHIHTHTVLEERATIWYTELCEG